MTARNVFWSDTLEGRIARYSLRIAGEGEAPFLLSSGRRSPYFVDLDYTMADATALRMVGQAVGEALLPTVYSVGGPAHGADLIATAASLYLSHTYGRLCHTFSVGKLGQVKGKFWSGDDVAIVDDVLTTGGSIIRAINQCRKLKLDIAQVIVIVDREEGGVEALRELLGGDIPVVALFRLSDLLDLKS